MSVAGTYYEMDRQAKLDKIQAGATVTINGERYYTRRNEADKVIQAEGACIANTSVFIGRRIFKTGRVGKRQAYAISNRAFSVEEN